MAKEALLDLQTEEKFERPVIKIDGKEYELSVKADLGLRESVRMTAIGNRMIKVSEKGDISDSEVTELLTQMRNAVKILVRDITDDVLKKLKEHHMLQIVESFSKTAGTKRQPAPSEGKPAQETEAPQPAS